MDSSAKILVGTAGWSYNDWEGIFYPLGMQHRREHPLTYLARMFRHGGDQRFVLWIYQARVGESLERSAWMR